MLKSLKFDKQIVFGDIKSGLIVFLIALPLSIGIAIASGAPPTAGLLAAVVGGILGSWLGGAYVTINGPAAGLIVVVLSAVETLGRYNPEQGFAMALAAIVGAGILQIFFGFMKWAQYGLVIPSAVVHGMLSAIGAIIIAKQIPTLLGVKATAHSIIGLYLEVPTEISHLNPQIAFIGVVCLLITLFLPKLNVSFVKKVPTALIVVVTGIALGKYFDLEHEHTVRYYWWSGDVNANYLLNLPQNLKDAIVIPNFSRFFTMDNFIAVISIALIGTIESVLSTFAVDKLDKEKRTSDLDKDLLSKGVCNTFLGFIGGLPIISEIVRSSANIDNGARTPLSNFVHGVMILVFVAFFPNLLHQVPLAALSALLIGVGWRLAHPTQFVHAKEIGRDNITTYLVTFITTLASDLLIGVAAGVVTKLVLTFMAGVKPRDLLKLKINTVDLGNETQIKIQGPIVFTNSLQLKRELDKNMQGNKPVTLDLSQVTFIGHSVMDMIDRTKGNYENNGTKIVLKNNEHLRPLSSHALATRKGVRV